MRWLVPSHTAINTSVQAYITPENVNTASQENTTGNKYLHLDVDQVYKVSLQSSNNCGCCIFHTLVGKDQPSNHPYDDSYIPLQTLFVKVQITYNLQTNSKTNTLQLYSYVTMWDMPPYVYRMWTPLSNFWNQQLQHQHHRDVYKEGI